MTTAPEPAGAAGNPEPTPPPVYDCRRGGRRHKVITTDGICVLCGARGVLDARHFPALPFDPSAPAT
ncbi:hypothetical protein [Microbacterium enclense]|uniref:hypothetical protein n=1 Tax=Microbacterium enclense TaxID=993073 RepID=UPI003D71CFC2